MKNFKPQVAMDLNFDLRPGGPFIPPTLRRAPVHGYSAHQRDYDRAQVAHMRHEAAESPECERMEHKKKKGRFF